MSRFFRGDSSSESSSDEEELYSDEEQEEQEEGSEEDSEDGSDDSDEDSDSEKEGTGGASRFMKDADSEDSSDESDDDGTKIVKSAKDKRLEEIEATIKLIENAEKINDWSVISSGRCYSGISYTISS
jgi:translation initiation factor 3 subunit C